LESGGIIPSLDYFQRKGKHRMTGDMENQKVIRWTEFAGILGGILYGGFYNLVFLLFFCVSTNILWRGKIKKE